MIIIRNNAGQEAVMRALKKALGFSVVHFFVGITVAFALTGQWAVALGVALVEPAINAVII